MLKCSFCAKAREEVKKLVAGMNGVFICNECCHLCEDIVRDPDPAQPNPISVESVSSRLFQTLYYYQNKLPDDPFAEKMRSEINEILKRHGERTEEEMTIKEGTPEYEKLQKAITEAENRNK